MKRRLFLAAFLGLLGLGARGAEAEWNVGYGIPAGREQQLLDLLRPYTLMGRRVEGWTLENIRIQQHWIEVDLLGPADERLMLTLVHPTVEGRHPRSPSFTILAPEPGNESQKRCIESFTRSLRDNDDGSFRDRGWVTVGQSTAKRQHSARSWAARASPSVQRFVPWPALGAMVALLAAAATWHRFQDRASNPQNQPGQKLVAGRQRADWLIAAGLALVTALAVLCEVPDFSMHRDTTRDLLLARDCAGAKGCVGATTSLAPLRQHVGWVRLLAAGQLLGMSPLAVYRVLAALSVMCLPAFFLFARRFISRPAALAGAAVFFIFAYATAELPTLWNPTLLPLATVVLFWGLGEVALKGHWTSSCLTAVGLVLVIETHVANFVLVPLAFIAIASCSRPLGPALLAATATLLGLELALSSDAVLKNLELAGRMGPAAAFGLAAALALAARWRHRIATWAPSTRAVVVFATVCAAVAGGLWLGSLVSGHPVAIRYGAAVVPGASLLVLWLADRNLRHSGVVLRNAIWVAVGIAGGALTSTAAASTKQPGIRGPVYTMGELQDLDRALTARGYADLGTRLRRVRAMEAWALYEGLAILAPSPEVGPAANMPDLRLLLVSDRTATTPPRGWRRVALGGERDAWLSPIEGWLQLDRASVCREGGECLELTSQVWAAYGTNPKQHSRFAYSSFKRIEAWLRKAGAARRYYFRVPIEVRGTDELRHVELLPHRLNPLRVRRVHGVAYRGQLGTPCLTLTRDGAPSGVLEIDITETDDGGHDLNPPQALETRASEQRIREEMGPYSHYPLRRCNP